VTTPGTTATDTEDTAAGVALTEALQAVARLHDEAMSTIAQLAEIRDAPVDQVRVVRLAERPTVAQRIEAEAA